MTLARHAGAIILRVAYGYVAKDHDDEFVEAGNVAMKSFNEGCTPGAYMVNNLPICEYTLHVKDTNPTDTACQCNTFRNGYQGRVSRK
jgi:hypothetical protein